MIIWSFGGECKRYRVAGVKSFPTYLLNHPGKSHGGVCSFFLEYIHSCTCRVRAADVAKEKDRPTAYTVPELSVLSLCATFRNSSRDVCLVPWLIPFKPSSSMPIYRSAFLTRGKTLYSCSALDQCLVPTPPPPVDEQQQHGQ